MSSSEASLKSRPMLGSATLTMNKSRLARQMPTQTIASTTLGEAEGRGAAGSTTSTACTRRMESLRSILFMIYVFHTGISGWIDRARHLDGDKSPSTAND